MQRLKNLKRLSARLSVALHTPLDFFYARTQRELIDLALDSKRENNG